MKKKLKLMLGLNPKQKYSNEEIKLIYTKRKEHLLHLLKTLDNIRLFKLKIKDLHLIMNEYLPLITEYEDLESEWDKYQDNEKAK